MSNLSQLPTDPPYPTGCCSTVRIGVMLSGRGSNCEAILNAITAGRLSFATVSVLLSNKPQATGLALGKQFDIPTIAYSPANYPSHSTYELALLEALQHYKVDLILLAGYIKIIGPTLLQAFPNRMLNIHPSLLPRHGGRGMYGNRVHQAVLEAGERVSGCSVHIVTDTVDGGPILGQARVPVYTKDTVETLSARVIQQEHRLYPQVMQAYLRDQFPKVFTHVSSPQ